MWTKPNRGILLNRLHPLSKGLVGLWMFNEGTGLKTFDLSGNSNHGTFGAEAAAPTWVIGRNGPSLYFDGDDYINSNAIITGTPLTISAWVKTNDLDDERRIVTINNGGTATNVLSILLDGATNKLQVQHFDTDGHGAFSDAAMSINKWHHCVGVFESDSSRTAYLDNVKGTANTAVRDAMSGLNVTDIGTLFWLGGRIQFWSGSIDAVMIYNRALSTSEIQLLYREPYCMFASIDDIAALYIALGLEYTESLIIELQSKYNYLSIEEHQLLKVLMDKYNHFETFDLEKIIKKINQSEMRKRHS